MNRAVNLYKPAVQSSLGDPLSESEHTTSSSMSADVCIQDIETYFTILSTTETTFVRHDMPVDYIALPR